jgi:DNA-binding MarR family transcriptional regulator
MSERPRAESADAWGSILRIHAALVPRLDQRLQAEAGVSLAWYDVLLELNAADGRRLRMSELGDRVVLSRTRVSRLVDELVRAGLVRREANPEDGRSAFAVMTSEGRSVLRRAAPAYLTAIEKEFATGVTTAELERLRRTLDGVLARLAAADARGGDDRVVS